ncbi:hypothetical protein [Vallitalea guaymasensis]|nr:hypothetical protein [Vallitalea guaymasensis]
MELEKYKKLFIQMTDDFGYKLDVDSFKEIDYFYTRKLGKIHLL